MNFLAHTYIAFRSHANPAVALGAALPDLQRIAGVRFDEDGLPSDVRLGIALHHRTDASFHSNPHFLSASHQLSSEAAKNGLPPGASRAIGHVGWELLLDGELIESTEAAQLFLRCCVLTPTIADALTETEHACWNVFAESLTNLWWIGYREPNFVAERLHRILVKRQRLAFAETDISVVAALLQTSKLAMKDLAPSILIDVLRSEDQPPAGLSEHAPGKALPSEPGHPA